MSDALVVTEHVSIPRDELDVRVSRSGGPGGQHVNTSSTRVEVRWNVRTTRAITDAERERVLKRLGRRVDTEGVVRVVSSVHRSQRRNREAAEVRLASLIRGALAVPRPRHATRPTRASVERRLETKRRHAEKKLRRREWED